jgi:hypothetical protein
VPSSLTTIPLLFNNPSLPKPLPQSRLLLQQKLLSP